MSDRLVLWFIWSFLSAKSLFCVTSREHFSLKTRSFRWKWVKTRKTLMWEVRQKPEAAWINSETFFSFLTDQARVARRSRLDFGAKVASSWKEREILDESGENCWAMSEMNNETQSRCQPFVCRRKSMMRFWVKSLLKLFGWTKSPMTSHKESRRCNNQHLTKPKFTSQTWHQMWQRRQCGSISKSTEK